MALRNSDWLKDAFIVSGGGLQKHKHAWIFSGRTGSEIETNREEIIPEALAAAACCANLQLRKRRVGCLSC